MKRIVDGVTFNTETSTRLARRRSDGVNESEKLAETLYQTRGGAFFIVEKRTTIVWNDRESENETRVERTFVPISSELAQSWMLKGEVHVFRNPFGDPPEAAGESESSATIYLRVPATLKHDVDEAARKQNLSGNVWAMRCIERGLEKPALTDFMELALIWEIAATFRAQRDRGEWTREQCLDALVAIAGYAYSAGEKVFGEKALDDIGLRLEGEPAYEKIRKKFAPFA